MRLILWQTHILMKSRQSELQAKFKYEIIPSMNDSGSMSRWDHLSQQPKTADDTLFFFLTKEESDILIYVKEQN